jgi:hypothetical protein
VAPKRPAYQAEPTWISEAAWSRGHLEAWELLKIAAWKSVNANLAWLSLNSPDEIVKVTGAALVELSAYRNASSRELRLRPDAWQAFLAATGTALGTTTGLDSASSTE